MVGIIYVLNLLAVVLIRPERSTDLASLAVAVSPPLPFPPQTP